MRLGRRRRHGRERQPLPIARYQRLSLRDYPGRLCAKAVVPGCNFRCPYCTKTDLVLDHQRIEPILEREVLDHLYRVRGYLDGLCVGGGEPTLHNGLLLFLYKVKALGYRVKLDTNGSRPKRLRKLMGEKVVDYVSLDIKAPLDRYHEVVRAKVDVDAVWESVRLLRRGHVDYEFRATAVPRLIDSRDLEEIAQTLVGSKRFVIQQYRPGKSLCTEFEGVEPYSEAKLEEFKVKVEPYFPECEIRV
ncbi:MAG: anaerobic ribonucleoside-triphosphate reductase activating protein [Candidatus Bathyarchaeota archaeon]|nr:MAG: anaerobic ribonucleoside-triphosphate reductase activating protein [Candidatus Bathyarchaeota archaeon]